MRNYIKITAAIISTLILVACQNPAAGNDNELNNQPEATKKEYTVTFNNNCPSMDGSTWYSCSEYAPVAIKAKEGESITLPNFSGELTKYVNNTEEGVYVFEKWNTSENGTGDSYVVGASYTVTGNITLYAVYSTEKKTGGNNENPESEVLDFSIKTSYSMKMGDTVDLASLIGTSSVYYEIQSGSDVVELGTGKLTAIGPGSAIVKAIDWEDSAKVWSCSIIVTVEGFSGSALDYKLVGRWEDGNSYLVFNTNKTGELKVYKNGSVIQESTFSWATMENSYGKYLTLSSCSADYLEGKQFTITSISASSMSLHGYMAFGSAQDTSWAKQ